MKRTLYNYLTMLIYQNCNVCFKVILNKCDMKMNGDIIISCKIINRFHYSNIDKYI